MLSFLREQRGVARSRSGRRKLRLFACGCCRQVWELIEDARSQRAVEVAEQFADRFVSQRDLAEAKQQASEAKKKADNASSGFSCSKHSRKVAAAIHAALDATESA